MEERLSKLKTSKTRNFTEYGSIKNYFEILLAAGSGSRMGAISKKFLNLY